MVLPAAPTLDVLEQGLLCRQVPLSNAQDGLRCASTRARACGLRAPEPVTATGVAPLQLACSSRSAEPARAAMGLPADSSLSSSMLLLDLCAAAPGTRPQRRATGVSAPLGTLSAGRASASTSARPCCSAGALL